jgi:hypothetical protein
MCNIGSLSYIVAMASSQSKFCIKEAVVGLTITWSRHQQCAEQRRVGEGATLITGEWKAPGRGAKRREQALIGERKWHHGKQSRGAIPGGREP